MNSTRISLQKHKCFNCGETFQIYVGNYIYKARCKQEGKKQARIQTFCSYNCRAKYLKMHPEAKIVITQNAKYYKD